MSNKNNVSSDLQGFARLITEATLNITDIVEAVHKRVVHPPLLPSTPIQDLISSIAGFVYQKVRWSTRLTGNGVEKALIQLSSVLGELKFSKDSEALYSGLNGVIGDYLEENKNPLEISMQYRHQAKTIELDKEKIQKVYPELNGKILLMVHGSCMNDIQWTRKGHNHGNLLSQELDLTPVYLHYNTGRHISKNGQDFNKLLEALVQCWPVPVEELNILAHSMGGLVSRSAIYYAQQQEKLWIKHFRKIIFLGTPHHGAPLEKAGNFLDVALESIPYAKPFARLGKIRSAGITDLRYGNLTDEDWKDTDRFQLLGDQRKHVSLPKLVDCYSIAGVAGKKSESVSAMLLGDNMVGVKSALGLHKIAKKNLGFKKENSWIAYENNHLDLLSSSNVYAKIKSWMV